MPANFNPYKYTTEEEVIEHLDFDLKRMVYSICKDGYVCQEQYEKLGAYLCENYANEIVSILSKETCKDIWYGFSPNTCFFVFYDKDKIDNEHAINKADELSHYLYD